LRDSIFRVIDKNIIKADGKFIKSMEVFCKKGFHVDILNFFEMAAELLPAFGF